MWHCIFGLLAHGLIATAFASSRKLPQLYHASNTFEFEKTAASLRTACASSEACGATDFFNLALSLSDLGELEAAVSYLAEAIKQDTSHNAYVAWQIRRQYATFLLQTGKVSEAMNVLETFAQSGPAHATRFELAWNLHLCHYALNLPKSPILIAIDGEVDHETATCKNAYRGWGAQSEQKIEVFPGLPSEFDFRGFVERRQPVRITSNHGDTAMALLQDVGLDLDTLLDPSKLRARAGDTPAFVQAVSDSGVFGFDHAGHRRLLCNFSGVLVDVFGAAPTGLRPSHSCMKRRIHKGEGQAFGQNWSVYMNLQKDLFKADPLYVGPLSKLKREVPIPSFLSNLRLNQINLWLGRGPSKSVLHCDHVDNLYVVLQGTKKFRVFPPSEAIAMKTVVPVKQISPAGVLTLTSNTIEGGMSSRYIRTDLSKDGMPLKTEAKAVRRLHRRGYNIKVSAGEMLYLPQGWFHEVASDGMEGHMAVNFFFAAPPNIDDLTLAWSTGNNQKRNRLHKPISHSDM